MKVMMICDHLPVGVGAAFGLPDENAGGWVSGMVEGIRTYADVELSLLAMEEAEQDSLQTEIVRGVTYHLLKYRSGEIVKKAIETYPADLYHLFGIENPHASIVFPYLPANRTLLYIQGLAEEYYYHYSANYDQYGEDSLPFRMYMRLNADMMKKRGEKETAIFRQGKYIAGRTDWDAAYVFKLNNGAQYCHLDETMRPVFYEAEKWDIEKMKPHRIFVTQAAYPIKAPHMILEIVKLLKEHYPDVECIIGGENILASESAATKLGISYAGYIAKLIRKYGLTDTVHYVGPLNQTQVIEELQKANVFLLASSIENSPNSLQEAMLVGTPCVSSDVGGVSTLVENRDQALLYPFDDPMLGAWQIAGIFEDKELAEKLSIHGRERISWLADPAKNARQLYDIYVKMYTAECTDK